MPVTTEDNQLLDGFFKQAITKREEIRLYNRCYRDKDVFKEFGRRMRKSIYP